MIVLADRGDEQNVIDEEKRDWVTEVLSALGVPDGVYELDENNMKECLSVMEIEVWKNVGGSIEIYREGEVVAQWNSPRLILIKSHPRWYYEIHIDAWALPLQEFSK